MTLSKLASLCTDFMNAADFPIPMRCGLAYDIEDAMTEVENKTMLSFMPVAVGGDLDQAAISLAEIFATVAYRLSREGEAAAYIDITQTDAQTAQDLRTKSAPNMAKLVEFARP
tara:strand:- start:801751 stop:802092 length:342 start_codon:yes stop_codon:yes gene_type:complete